MSLLAAMIVMNELMGCLSTNNNYLALMILYTQLLLLLFGIQFWNQGDFNYHFRERSFNRSQILNINSPLCFSSPTYRLLIRLHTSPAFEYHAVNTPSEARSVAAVGELTHTTGL